MDLVSIIVPVYNVEKYLAQCVQSITTQEYNNVEIILVDDGSKDNSGAICDSLAADDSRITVVHKKNEGLGLTRNAGLKVAHGKFVVFIDSDDYISSDLICRLVNASSEDIDICVSGFTKVDNNGKILFEEKYEPVTYKNISVKKEMFPRLLGSSPVAHDAIRMSSCGVLYRKSIIDRFNLKFESERKMISEDLIFNMDFYQVARGARVIENAGYFYRTNPDSLTKSYNSNKFRKSCFFYEETKKMLEKLGYGEDEYWRLQRQFFITVRVCIRQERSVVSKKKMKDSIKSIGEICDNKMLYGILSTYPKKNLGFKQKVFLELLLRHCSIVLYLLAQFHLI